MIGGRSGLLSEPVLDVRTRAAVKKLKHIAATPFIR